MARVLLALALLAVSSSLAAGSGFALCDNKKAPSPPWNTLLTSNVPEGGKAKLTVTWRGSVKSPSDGCVQSYLLEVVDNGKVIASQSVDAKPDANSYKGTVMAPPGKQVTVRVSSMKDSNKVPANVGSVKTAGSPVTATPLRRML